ncbi:MAG: hypothetical protein Q4A84_02990 [Neisseria sp.]|uniref:hypothetical protein n=1 Tax=Neisseria sp. TaxID=192066 RepID=UPI0026DC55FA|nr:hypothetical protein [Neisseria sp.]MDO4640656.1 hypothetical protein [Neisseria sp.]
MPQTITQKDIQRYRDDIKQHGVEGTVRVYSELQQKGYGYAGWAKGVAEAGLFSGSLTGRSAVGYLKNIAGRELSEQELDSIRIEMARGYLNVLEVHVKLGHGQTRTDVKFKEARNFHRQVFEAHKLDINNWTLEIPMQLVGKYEGEEKQEELWQGMMKTEGDYMDSWMVSNELYERVGRYATGHLDFDRAGNLIMDTHSGALGLDTQRALGTHVRVDKSDQEAAQQWVDKVSIAKAIVTTQAEEWQHQYGVPNGVPTASADDFDSFLAETDKLLSGLRAGDGKALENFFDLPQIAMVQKQSEAETAMLLRQNPELGNELLPNHFKRFSWNDMPDQAQKLFHESRELLANHYQDNHIRTRSWELDNQATALTAAAYASGMRSVSMMDIQDGIIQIGDRSPDLRMASVEERGAAASMQHEQFAQIKQTEQVFLQEEHQREMEKQQQSHSRGISMS